MNKHAEIVIFIRAVILLILLLAGPASTVGGFAIWLISLNQFYQLLLCAAIIGIPGAIYFIFRKKRRE